MSDSVTPTVDEVVAGWSSYNYYGSTRNWKQELNTWQASIGKPLIFTEIGFASHDSCGNPNNTSSVLNAQAQANCYEGTLKAFASESWLSGMFWWQWFSNTTQVPQVNTGWTPQYKLAQAVMTNYWGGDNTTTYLGCTSNSASVAVSDAAVATHMTLVVPATATTNTAFVVTGVLTTTGGVGIANQTVQLQKAGANVSGKTATTNSTGAYSISVTEATAGTYTYQVVYAGGTV